MQINISFDQNQSSLPAGFVAAVNYVVNYFDSVFTNAVTVNIHVAYGEIAGQRLGAGARETYIDSYSYSQVVGALKSNEPSAAQQHQEAVAPTTIPNGDVHVSA